MESEKKFITPKKAGLGTVMPVPHSVWQPPAHSMICIRWRPSPRHSRAPQCDIRITLGFSRETRREHPCLCLGVQVLTESQVIMGWLGADTPKTRPDILDLSHCLCTPRQLADGWATAVGGPVRWGQDGGGHNKMGWGVDVIRRKG